jgi:DNA gyrase subunit B
MSSSYGAEGITVLEGLEAVRKRPGMYIGSTSIRGLHHLVYEIVDNAVDEALAGHCDDIKVNILPDNIIEVIDNGRGIPTGIHPKYGKSALEIVLTVLHAGGKFENDNYKVSGGLHGVGSSVVNALSEWIEVYVQREGHTYYQKFHRGKPEEDVKIIGDSKKTGTRFVFKADSEIFETLEYEYKTLRDRLKEQAYLNKGIKITITDTRKPDDKKKEELCFEGGIVDFLAEIVKEEQKLFEESVYMEGEAEGVTVEVAMTYTEKQREAEYSFVNNINTHEGGTHLSGFRTALTRVINDVSKDMGLIKDRDGKFQGADVREGLTCIVSVKVPQPQFEGQTKTKLGNSEVTGIVSSLVGEKLKFFLEDHPAVVKIIVEKILLTKKAREAARKARELVMRKSALEIGSLPGKLADCSSKKPEDSEIFIVEGDSAGGSAKQGRDRFFQAILPLRGKILNVEKAGLHKALENQEIRNMITAFGANVGADMDLEKLRYHKIVIMTDADVDGAHIRTLMLTFFYRYMPELIKEGKVYIAQPPLYRVEKNKQHYYVYDDIELEKLYAEIGRTGIKEVQRYKGLGEMDAQQLWETTLDPKTRILKRVEIEDARMASDVTEVLMGTDVPPRKAFIYQHAQNAQLDI